MRNTLLFGLTLFCLLSLKGLTFTETLHSYILTESDKNLADLLQRIEEVRLEHNVPAVGITLIKNAEVEWQGSLGVANRDSNRIADENTFYRVGSITKTFTALAILKLQEQGKLELSDKLRDYVSTDYFQNPWAEEHPITIEQLLEHTAGLTDMGTAEFGHEDPTPISLDDALEFNSENHRVLWQPGLHSSYSNLGTGFVGAVIEKVSQKTYDDFLTDSVLKPLNMMQSSTLLTSQVRSSLATGYDSGGWNENDYWHLIFRPFGALNSSPKEMANLLKLLVNRGTINGERFLSEASIERMENPATTLAAKAGLKFGYGLGNYHTEHKGFVFHGHGGTTAGYLARFDYLLENASGYAVMINSNNSSAIASINKLIRDYLVESITPVNIRNDRPLNENLSDYLGYYQPVTSRSRVAKFLKRFLGIKRLTLEQNQLILTSFLGEPSRLIHQGNNFYRESNDSNADLALLKNTQGEIFLQNDDNYQRISTIGFYSKMVTFGLTILLTISSLFYLCFFLLKHLLMRKLPNKRRWLNLLGVSPFLLLISLFLTLTVFSTEKGSIGDILFDILGTGILFLSVLGMVLALFNKSSLGTRLLHFMISIISTVMGLYLYHSDLISQPIWS